MGGISSFFVAVDFWLQINQITKPYVLANLCDPSQLGIRLESPQVQS